MSNLGKSYGGLRVLHTELHPKQSCAYVWLGMNKGGGANLTPTEARELAAELVRLADEHEAGNLPLAKFRGKKGTVFEGLEFEAEVGGEIGAGWIVFNPGCGTATIYSTSWEIVD